jgi:hypothetical protein
MRYVIIRDDDTNALTPVECLERLYQPFLQRNLPVNLAVIPNVRTHITYGDGILEGFLTFRNGTAEKFAPITGNKPLVRYLAGNSGFHIVQHGCHHEFINGNCEFEQTDSREVSRRLEEGAALLINAGFSTPETFVAPYDRFTRKSLKEVARRFRVISTGWFELGRLPISWWPQYLWKKARRKSHWRANGTLLLSHPGCHLSYQRPYQTILDRIKESIRSRPLTVLVTHWWEFFRDQKPDEPLIEVLHAAADYLSSDPDIKVISFRDLARCPEKGL